MSSQTLAVLVAAVSLFAAGCGSKEADTSASSTPSAEPAAGSTKTTSTAPVAGTPRAIEITANDAMKFSITRIEAKAGETLRVVLQNVGSLPKAAMGHNFVLLKAGVKPEEIAAAAAMAGPAKDYFPEDRADQIIAHTRLIGPKEKAEVTFQVPAEPGEYAFLCTFPGHVAAGMKGVLVVTE